MGEYDGADFLWVGGSKGRKLFLTDTGLWMEDYIILKRMINASQHEAGSIHNMPSQGMLSRSHSRLQSTVQKLDSHIRSTSPLHHGTLDKKYLDV